MEMNKTHTERGAAMLLFIIFFVIAISSLLAVLGRNLTSDIYTIGSVTSAKQSYLVGEASLEEVGYRIIDGADDIDTAFLDTLLGMASTTVTHDSDADTYIIRTSATTGRSVRENILVLERAPGSSFNYGVQTGNGGFFLGNNATIKGNVYSNGHIISDGGGEVTIDAVSAGPDGRIEGMDIGGNAWANTLADSTVGGDAHYNNEEGSNTVAGDRIQPFDVLEPEPLPIAEEELDEWQQDLLDNGSITRATDERCDGGVYEVDDSEVVGMRVIECDLSISGNNTYLIMDGPIWVQGDVSFSNGGSIDTTSSVGSDSVYLIADDPDDRENRGRIEFNNQTNIDTQDEDSFVFLISRNNSAANGGPVTAISLNNLVEGDVVLYSNEGEVDLANNTEIHSVTGYQINVANNTDIEYKDGLQNVIFSGGPGSTYAVSAWYQE